MTSCEDITGAVLTPAEAAALNNAPVSVAGNDQSYNCVAGTTMANLSGSASSDEDGNLLTYSWNLNGVEVSTSENYSPSLGHGTHTFTLTVSDGELSASDDVVVTVVTDVSPPTITLAGDATMSLTIGAAFTDPGATAADACDGPVTVSVGVDGVDVNTPGDYIVTYTATDAGGNSSTVDRVVTVFNTAPEVVDAIYGVELSFGDDLLSATIDLSTVFGDVNVNDVLTYSYTNADEGVALSSMTGSMLSFEAVDLGESFVAVTAVDPWGAQVIQPFVVTVNVTPDLAGALLFAETKIDLKKEVDVFSGNIVINETHEHEQDGHNHDHEELKIDKDVHIAAGYKVMADGIKVKHNTLIESDVYVNELENQGDITGDIYEFGATPLFSTLPPFKSAPAGSQNITVHRNDELILEPGDYHRIKVEDYGILTFTGGVYNIEKLEAKKHSHIRFEESTEIRVEKELKIKKDVYVGPAAGSYIDASDIIFYVDNEHHHNDDHDHHHHHHHHTAKLEENVLFYGTIYSPEGKVELKKKASFTGAILAAEIKIDKESELTLDSYFDVPVGGGVFKRAGTAWVEPAMAV